MSPTAGELITESLAYDGGRAVAVYLPSRPVEAVVFAADGGWHISGLVDALESGDAPPTLIVGVHGMDDDERRFAEYVPGVDEARFAEHEDFFVNQVAEWVRSRLGVRVGAERTGVWGASLGGEFALAMGVRHPDVYGAVFSASPGGGYRPTGVIEGVLPSFYLVAGQHEPFFAENARRWLDAVLNAHGDAVMNVRDGDHGGAFWYEEFPLMVSWAFGGASALVPTDGRTALATSAALDVPDDIVERVRALCLALPEVTVRLDVDSGARSFDVHGRSFCLLVARHGSLSGKPVTLLVVRAPEEREALVATGDPFYKSKGGPDRVAVRLSASTDWQEIRELVTDSYRAIAPRKLAARID